MPEKVNNLLKKLESGFLGFWVKQYKVSFLFILLIVFMGAFSFLTINKESSPSLDLGFITIATPYPGVNPTDVDSLITEKIEREIKDVDGIKKITSDSTLGFSSIVVELSNGVSVRETMTDIRDKIDSLSLPQDAEDTIVSEINSEDNTLFSLMLTSDTLSKDALLMSSHKIKNNLEGMPGINKVTVRGDNEYEIKVLLDQNKIKNLGLSVNEIASTIQSYNKNFPIGNFSNGGLNYDFRFVGEIRDYKSLETIPVKSNGNSIIYLKDIAKVRLHFKNDTKEVGGLNKGDAKTAIILTLEKKSGANIDSSAKKAKESVEKELNRADYKGIEHTIVNDFSEIVQESYSDLFGNIKSTFLLVFLTLFVFIGFKEGLISLVIVPMAYMITFTVLKLMGQSLNFLTNFSLILSLGVAIDTIIVIIEGANKKLKLGYDPKSAILLAGQEYKAPIISGTLTTLAAFIPLLTLPGAMGKYLGYIPITVFITLLASLFLTLTVTSPIFWKLSKKLPYYRKDEKEEEALSEDAKALLDIEREGKMEKVGTHSSFRDKIFGTLSNLYYRALKKVISTTGRRRTVILTPIVLLILSFMTLNIPFTLFPASDNPNVTVTVEGKEGKDDKEMVKYVPILEDIASNIDEVRNYNISVSGNIITGNIELFTKNYRDENGLRNSFEVEKEIRDQLYKFPIEEVNAKVSVAAGGPPGGNEIGIDLRAESANDVPTLIAIAKDFEKQLRNIPGSKNVEISGKSTPGQFQLKLDREKVSSLGLTPDMVFGEVYAKTNGIQGGTIKGLYKDYDIKIKIADYDENLSTLDIENIKINSPKGEVRVGDIAEYETTESIAKVSRKNNKITLTVSSGTEEGFYSSDIQPALIEIAENYSFPEGISYASASETDENADLIQSTISAFIITLFLIFMILVFQFNSYGQPLIVLYSVILALLGVNTGLYILGVPYSMAFGIGFVALTGIVVNNAIVYIDKINLNLSEGLDKMESVIEAGKSRLIPMVVTTITTIFGILPIALQDEFWLGLGATIIFGLIAGTLMTLFVIPSLYYQVFLTPKKHRIRRLIAFFKKPKGSFKKKLVK